MIEGIIQDFTQTYQDGKTLYGDIHNHNWGLAIHDAPAFIGDLVTDYNDIKNIF